MSSPLLTSSKALARTKHARFCLIRSRNAGRKAGHVGDPQNEIIRRVLYPSNIRNRETPTGTWRPDVAKALRKAIPSKQAHETIERAWLLHERHLRWKREEETNRKFECMRRAMAELEMIDPYLFKEANRAEDSRKRSEAETERLKNLKGVERKAMERRLPGLFPPELRLPTDTPPRTGWDYDWKSPSSSS